MNEIRKEAIGHEVCNIYDDYACRRIDKRQCQDKLPAYAIGGFRAASLLSIILPKYKSYACPDVYRSLQNDSTTS
jgi:hypothetical protein